MRRARRTIWRRTTMLGGILIEVAVLVLALALDTVFGVLDRRR